MIHAFKCLGQNLILDVDTSALYSMDEPAWEAASLFKTMKTEDIVQSLSQRYPLHDIESAVEELVEMETAGMLFSDIDFEGQQLLNDEKSLKAVCLHVAHDCNLRCDYCFASKGDFDQGRKLMPETVGLKALEMLIENSGSRKSLEVDFFGGEPLMNLDVVKQLVIQGNEMAAKAGKTISFTLTTNGLALNDDICAYLNDNMKNVVISLDGRKEIHDALRKTIGGKGSFDIIMPKLKRFVELRGEKDHYVRGTFTKANLDFCSDVLFLADNGFEQISIEPVVLRESEEAAIKESDLPSVFLEYEKLAGEYIQRRKSGDFFNFFHFMVDLENGPCVGKRLRGCGAGTEYVAVTPDGDIYPCHQFVGKEEYLLGNVDTGIVNGDICDSFSQNYVLNKEDCRNCWCKFFCSGGCAANGYSLEGDITKPYKTGCEMQKKRVECALAIYAIEKEENMIE